MPHFCLLYNSSLLLLVVVGTLLHVPMQLLKLLPFCHQLRELKSQLQMQKGINY
jgi:hypothetical protein